MTARLAAVFLTLAVTLLAALPTASAQSSGFDLQAHRGGRGDALVFFNLDEAGQPDPRTLHAGLAPTRGEKWLLSQWIRDGDLPGVGREYGLAFQGPEHTRAAWGRTLQVVEVRARALTDWQDVAMCVNC